MDIKKLLASYKEATAKKATRIGGPREKDPKIQQSVLNFIALMIEIVKDAGKDIFTSREMTNAYHLAFMATEGLEIPEKWNENESKQKHWTSSKFYNAIDYRKGGNEWLKVIKTPHPKGEKNKKGEVIQIITFQFDSKKAEAFAKAPKPEAKPKAEAKPAVKK